ncbi:phosphatidate cytidylyltransferase [Modestobacter sp. URMC 112]
MARHQSRPEPPGPGNERARGLAGFVPGLDWDDDRAARPLDRGGADLRPRPSAGHHRADSGPLRRVEPPPVPPAPPTAEIPATGPDTWAIDGPDDDPDPDDRYGAWSDEQDDADGDEPPATALPGALGAEATGVPPHETPSGAPAPASGRAGRDMAAAVSVGLGLGAVILASLLVWRPAFLLVLTVAVLIAVVELSRALEDGGHRPALPPLLVGSLAIVALAWTRGPTGLVVAFLLTVFAVLLWRLGDGPVGYLRDASAAAFVALYVPLLAGFAVLMLVPDDGAVRVVTFIVTVVCSDVGGFAAGVLFGKHPLARSVSPKKSWEGLAGSVAACALAGTLLITLGLDGPWWGGVLFGVAIALTSTLGDLGESLLKRDLGIKDMGAMLPGHGGLMDRMDSLLPSAAVAYLLLSVVAPT